MKLPLQITFHQLPPSPALEADIRQAAEELEGALDGIISCRVLVEMPHRHHQQGRLFRVRVDVGVPGGHIVAGRAPDEHAAHEDAHVAVRDAFRAVRRQLDDRAQRLRGEVKTHAGT
jgi:ribosome-associated translation inhibitor RaiA